MNTGLREGKGIGLSCLERSKPGSTLMPALVVHEPISRDASCASQENPRAYNLSETAVQGRGTIFRGFCARVLIISLEQQTRKNDLTK